MSQPNLVMLSPAELRDLVELAKDHPGANVTLKQRGHLVAATFWALPEGEQATYSILGSTR